MGDREEVGVTEGDLLTEMVVVEVAQEVAKALPVKHLLPVLLTEPLRLTDTVTLGLADKDGVREGVTEPLRERVPLVDVVEDTLCDAWVLPVGEMEGEREPL